MPEQCSPFGQINLPPWNQKGNTLSRLEIERKALLPFYVGRKLAPYDHNTATFGLRLRRLRRQLRLTIAQFATKAKLGANTVARLEKLNGWNPKPWVLTRILAAFSDEIQKAFPKEPSLFDWAVPPTTTANKIRNLRLRHGLSQHQLAQKLGLSRQAIYRYERGQNEPTTAVLERLRRRFASDFTLASPNAQKAEVAYGRKTEKNKIE